MKTFDTHARMRAYRATLIRLAKMELDRATLYPKGSYLRRCHMNSAQGYVGSAKRLTANLHA